MNPGTFNGGPTPTFLGLHHKNKEIKIIYYPSRSVLVFSLCQKKKTEREDCDRTEIIFVPTLLFKRDSNQSKLLIYLFFNMSTCYMLLVIGFFIKNVFFLYIFLNKRISKLIHSYTIIYNARELFIFFIKIWMDLKI